MDMNFVSSEELQAALEILPERTMVEIHNSVLRIRLEAALADNAKLRHQIEILEQAVKTPAPAVARQAVLLEDEFNRGKQETAIIGNGG